MKSRRNKNLLIVALISIYFFVIEVIASFALSTAGIGNQNLISLWSIIPLIILVLNTITYLSKSRFLRGFEFICYTIQTISLLFIVLIVSLSIAYNRFGDFSHADLIHMVIWVVFLIPIQIYFIKYFIVYPKIKKLAEAEEKKEPAVTEPLKLNEVKIEAPVKEMESSE